MATITRRGGSYRVRYVAPDGKQHSKSFRLRMDADRWAREVERSVDRGEWLDPKRGAITVEAWAESWLKTRHDLRPTTLARLEGVVRLHVLKEFGDRKISSLSNAEVRAWVAEMIENGTGATTVRKSVFALRRMMDAAIADQRLSINPAAVVDLPTEQQIEQRFLSREEVATLADKIDPAYRAFVMLAAYGGLRLGELTALRRDRIDVLRSRVVVAETAVQVKGEIQFGPPKTTKSKRTVPVARAVMKEVAEHLDQHVRADADSLLFTSPGGGPLWRASFARDIWGPATRAAGLAGLRIHDLRH